jgi:hypothetical protein
LRAKDRRKSERNLRYGSRARRERSRARERRKGRRDPRVRLCRGRYPAGDLDAPFAEIQLRGPDPPEWEAPGLAPFLRGERVGVEQSPLRPAGGRRGRNLAWQKKRMEEASLQGLLRPQVLQREAVGDTPVFPGGVRAPEEAQRLVARTQGDPRHPRAHHLSAPAGRWGTVARNHASTEAVPSAAQGAVKSRRGLGSVILGSRVVQGGEGLGFECSVGASLIQTPRSMVRLGLICCRISPVTWGEGFLGEIPLSTVTVTSRMCKTIFDQVQARCLHDRSPRAPRELRSSAARLAADKPDQCGHGMASVGAWT